jgi:hypothetical protein
MVGINDRETKPAGLNVAMSQLLKSCERHDKITRIYMQQVPIPHTLSGDAVTNLKALNEEIIMGFSNTFTVPPPDDLEMASDLPDEVHFTPACITYILDAAIDYIKKPMSVDSSPGLDA